MQNPFRHRPQDDFGRQDHERDDRRWEARDQRYDEGRSWSEGDGGRTAEAFRNQGQYGRDERDFSRSRDWGASQSRQTDYAGGSFDQYGYGAQPSGPSWGHDRGGFGGRDDRYRQRDFSQGRGQDWSARRDQGEYYGRYPEHGYAPGSQIWESSGQDYYGTSGRRMQSERDYEPDYLHWRQQQLSNLDRDYDAWRSERRQKFASDFDTWRASRPRTEAGHRQADNPIVGDVSDGGTGNAKDAKER